MTCNFSGPTEAFCTNQVSLERFFSRLSENLIKKFFGIIKLTVGDKMAKNLGFFWKFDFDGLENTMVRLVPPADGKNSEVQRVLKLFKKNLAATFCDSSRKWFLNIFGIIANFSKGAGNFTIFISEFYLKIF